MVYKGGFKDGHCQFSLKFELAGPHLGKILDLPLYRLMICIACFFFLILLSSSDVPFHYYLESYQVPLFLISLTSEHSIYSLPCYFIILFMTLLYRSINSLPCPIIYLSMTLRAEILGTKRVEKRSLKFDQNQWVSVDLHCINICVKIWVSHVAVQ